MPHPHNNGIAENADTEEYLTVKEVARRWRMSNQYVYGLIDRGELPFYKMGRTLRIRRIDLLDYESRLRAVDGPAPSPED